MTFEAKRTPGDWTYQDGSVYSSDGVRLLQADRDEPQTAPWERDRNVELAAQAPALLEALRACREELLALGMRGKCPALAQATAALADAGDDV